MSNELPSSDEDRPIDDAHLRAALAHAPDRDAAPPPSLSAHIRAEALRATATARPGTRRRLWSWLDLLQRPAIGAAFASLVLGTAIVLIWRDADVSEVMQPEALRQPAPAALQDRAAPTPRGSVKPLPAPAAAGRAEAPPPAQPAPKKEEPPAARQREPRRTAPADPDSRGAQKEKAARSNEAPPQIAAAAPRAAAPPVPKPAAPETSTPPVAEAAPPVADALPPLPRTPALAESPELTAAAPAAPPAAPAPLAGGDAERRLDKASIASTAPAGALTRNLAAASAPLDPLAPLQSALAPSEPAGAWLREVGALTRGRWQLRAPAAAAAPLYGPGGALLGHLAVDDDGVLWQPTSLASRAWRAPLPASDIERLRRALADWRDQAGSAASAPR